MKRVKIYLGMLAIAVASMISCQSDSVEEQIETEADFETVKRTNVANENVENSTVIKHIYSYNREEFSVDYMVDNESGEVLSVAGDVNRAEELFSTDERASSILITDLEEYNPDAVVETPDTVTIKLQLFDSEVEMEAFVEADGERIPAEEGEYVSNAEGPCSSFELGGQGRFYFYGNEYYGNEMTSLRKTNRFYFRNHDISGPYNGSDMSSLIVIKPYYKRSYTVLYESTCFNHRRLAFYQRPGYVGFGIPKLSRYTFNRWFLRISWDNQVESMKGFVW